MPDNEVDILSEFGHENADENNFVAIFFGVLQQIKPFCIAFKKFKQRLSDVIKHNNSYRPPLPLGIFRLLGGEEIKTLQKPKSLEIVHSAHDPNPDNIMVVDSVHAPYRVEATNFWNVYCVSI